MAEVIHTIEAARRLGVSRQTLYSYVSRGLVRSSPAGNGRSVYNAQDIAALVARRAVGRARRDVASSTIDFGEPILHSALTRIADGRCFYRDQEVAAWSDTATLEQTACLLWGTGSLPPVAAPDSGASPGSPLERCLRAVADSAGRSDWAERPEQVFADATRLLHRVAAAACGGGMPQEGPIHHRIARGWALDADTADLLRRALVLCADHELNASTYAARAVASTGASLAASVLAGLAALSGPRHGGMTDRVRALALEADVRRDPMAAFSARLARGETLPGFGHRLYAAADPRADSLLAALRPVPAWDALIAAARALTGLPPTIDVALAALEDTRGLPAGGGLALFATGRTVGWIAHALEQRADGRLIRPRAAGKPG